MYVTDKFQPFLIHNLACHKLFPTRIAWLQWGFWMGLGPHPSAPCFLDLGGRSHEMAPLVWRKPNVHLDMFGIRTRLGGLAEATCRS